MEGKEVRFGIPNSALWAVARPPPRTVPSTRCMIPIMPLGGAVTLVMMQLGEVVFGGVGSGLYGVLVFVIVAVFVAGLLVGRTPEYLGHKIEAYEMKMASLLILIMPITVLGVHRARAGDRSRTGDDLAIRARTDSARYSTCSHRRETTTEAHSPASVPTPRSITCGRDRDAHQPVLACRADSCALAGSLAAKKLVPAPTGPLPRTRRSSYSGLIAVVIIVGALNFIPALALGPIVEHFMLVR